MVNDFKAIIFDVHKTLVDDVGFPRERIWELMKQSGASLDLNEYYELYDSITQKLFYWPAIEEFIEIKEIHRRRLQLIYSHFGVHREVESDVRFLWDSLAECNLYPEVESALRTLSENYKLALLTNADNDDPLLEIVRSTGVKFDAIVTSAAARCYKPKKEIFDYTLDKLKLGAEKAVMVGDSLVADVLGAANAGIFSVWVNRSGKKRGNDFPEPNLTVRDLSELTDFLNS